MKNRYAILTVDTEALPNRAPNDHVNRLILGIHGEHSAGVREMANIGSEFGASLVFFLDLCGAIEYRDELEAVAKWLHRRGQDVQLHAHPEYLPKSFWQQHKRDIRPYYLNTYTLDRANFIITHFANMLKSFTGQAPRAFRAGSFRWNSCTLGALQKNGITFSFNNSMCAVYNQQCPFSVGDNAPFQWSNGIIEIPVTERRIFSFINPTWWARLQYPQSRFFKFRTGAARLLPGSVPDDMDLMVFLIHSWSFLYRDADGFEVYRDDRLMSRFRKFLKKLSSQCEIITTAELSELIASGEIRLSHVEKVANARYNPERQLMSKAAWRN